MSTHMMALYLMACAAGMVGGVHVPINGALGVRIQSPLMATLLFYGIGFAITGAAFLAFGNRDSIFALKTVPPWYFLAGVLSFIWVASNTFLMPRLGAIHLFVIVLSFQMIARMVISHYGWLESPVSPISLSKLLGALMLMGGALLVVRK